ncbi:MAG: hypothetical protein JNL21_22345 [Myxococcales bacterium]|nr:hypothetical protein [Myxococcales bacterium]
MRGVTIGPIESVRHPERGYGTEANGRALDEAVALGATWVSLTPFGRVHDLTPGGIDLSFEAPFEENRKAVIAAARQAKERGLRVMLVPHLWVESKEWRALIDPGTDEGWQAWAQAYRGFLLSWAAVAAEADIDLLSVGVELRSWVTTPRVALLLPIIDEVRARYRGLLTYSSNWDDAEATLLWDAVDLVGINAFYPLAEKDGAGFPELEAGGARVAAQVDAFARRLGKPVVLTEVGYTTRRDPAIRPWEWPDDMKSVTVDEEAQALAYRALLGPFIQSESCAGFFVWRYYADPDDVSQEAAWGFSPRGKLAEVVLRDAFAAHFAVDGPWLPGAAGGRHRARTPWAYGWEPSPPLFADVDQ